MFALHTRTQDLCVCVQAGDLGSLVGSTLAQIDAAHCLGFHTNFFPELFVPLWVPLVGQWVLPESDLVKLRYPIPNLIRT